LAKGWLRLDPGESKNGEGREFPFTPDMRAVLEAQREIVRTIERERAYVIPWVFVQADAAVSRTFAELGAGPAETPAYPAGWSTTFVAPRSVAWNVQACLAAPR
jgi:hypothetical protein